MSLNQGKIVSLSEKGFGFMKVEGLEKNLFFHAKDLVDVRFDELMSGDELVFDSVETTDRGACAKGVQKF